MSRDESRNTFRPGDFFEPFPWASKLARKRYYLRGCQPPEAILQQFTQTLLQP